MAKSDPVVVVGAGPVGLCLALALAQQDIAVVLIESGQPEHGCDTLDLVGSERANLSGPAAAHAAERHPTPTRAQGLRLSGG